MTDRVLDFVENLPAFHGGFIEQLQYVRQRQRKEAEKLYAETRSPVGTGGKYLGFRLFELFPAEEYSELISGLRRLFPMTPYGRDQIDRFATRIPSLFQGGWSSIGMLLPKKKRLLGPLETRLLPDLPDEVEYIEVTAHSVMPSAVVISFDVHLSNTATEQLERLHSRRYLPDTWFHTWKLWRTYPRSESSAEWALQDAINNWQTVLHARVERAVAPYLTGFFRRSTSGTARLPCIDTFSVTGVPESSGVTPKLWEGLRSWMDSFILQSEMALFDSYSSPELMFTWAEHSEERPPVPYRLIELHAQAPSNDPTKLQGMTALRDPLDAVLPYICFLEAISRVAEKLETIRILVYRALARKRAFAHQLGAEMKLNNRVQMEAAFISRLGMEFEDAKPWLKNELRLVEGLKRSPFRDGKEYNLADTLESSLRFRLDRVRKHFDLISKMFADYVARRNIAVMYRLQRQVWVLAIVATIATVVSVAVNWTQASALFHRLLGR